MDAPDKVGRRAIIHGHHLNPAGDTCPKNSDPLGPVFTPDDKPIALVETLPVKIRHARPNASVEFTVSQFPGAKAVIKTQRFTATHLAHFREDFQKRLHSSSIMSGRQNEERAAA